MLCILSRQISLEESEEEQAAFVAILSNQLGTLAGASMAMGAMNA